jgi:hypothetical protein
MAPVIRILCFRCVAELLPHARRRHHRGDRQVRYEVYTRPSTPRYRGGVHRAAPFGIEAVAYAVLIASAIFYAAKLVTVPSRSGSRSGAASAPRCRRSPPALSCMLSSTSCSTDRRLWLATSGHWTRLFAGTAVGMVVYPVPCFSVAPRTQRSSSSRSEAVRRAAPRADRVRAEHVASLTRDPWSVVYHGVLPYDRSRHRGLINAYAAGEPSACTWIRTFAREAKRSSSR